MIVSYIPPAFVPVEVISKLAQEPAVLKLYENIEMTFGTDMRVVVVKNMGGFPVTFKRNGIQLRTHRSLNVEYEDFTWIVEAGEGVSAWQVGKERTERVEFHREQETVDINFGGFEFKEVFEYERYHPDYRVSFSESLINNLKTFNVAQMAHRNEKLDEIGKEFKEHLKGLGFVEGHLDFRSVTDAIAEAYSGAEY